MVEDENRLTALANSYNSPCPAYRHTQGILLGLREGIIDQLARPDFFVDSQLADGSAIRIPLPADTRIELQIHLRAAYEIVNQLLAIPGQVDYASKAIKQAASPIPERPDYHFPADILLD